MAVFASDRFMGFPQLKSGLGFMIEGEFCPSEGRFMAIFAQGAPGIAAELAVMDIPVTGRAGRRSLNETPCL